MSKETLDEAKPLHDKFKKLGILGILQEPNEHFDLDLNGEILLPAICLRIESLNLAVYPHDERGFGCIGLYDDTKNGLNFLEFCKSEKNAKVVLKEQNSK